MNFTQYCKHAWFVVFMVFAIGCSAVSHAFSQPMHALMGNALDQSAHCMQMSGSVHHSDDQKAHGEHNNTQHQDHNAVKHAVSQLSICQAGDTNFSSAMQSCADCSAAYCQVSNLAVTQQAVALAVPIFSPMTHHLLGRYKAQHLVGFNQEILRPPRA